MNIEDTKKAIAVMQAYVDGKDIQYRPRSEKWPGNKAFSPLWDWHNFDYRTKPEPKIIYVNEYENESAYLAPRAYPSIGEAEANKVTSKSVTAAYVRLSDVDLLK